MIDVYYLWNRTEWSLCRRRLLMGLLPGEMRQRAERFRRWQDAQAYAAGKLLLAHIFRIPPCEMVLSYTANGRPYMHDAYDFNISHSDGLVVFGVSDHGRIGIDIEAETEIDVLAYRSLFTPEEWMGLVTSEQGMIRGFYEYWTKKEAVLKADGCGLIHPLHKVRLLDKIACFHQQWWTVKKLDIAPGYTCHAAMDIPQAIRTPRDLTYVIELL